MNDVFSSDWDFVGDLIKARWSRVLSSSDDVHYESVDDKYVVRVYDAETEREIFSCPSFEPRLLAFTLDRFALERDKLMNLLAAERYDDEVPF